MYTTDWSELRRRFDPRIFQVLAIGSYALLARQISYFQRPNEFVAVLLLYSVCIDVLIGRFVYKKIKVPYTAFIAAIASSLTIDSAYLGIYLFAVTVAIVGKAFLTMNGRHFLNPANSGIVFALLLFPDHAAGIPRLFNFDARNIVISFAIGLAVATYARVLQIALLWIFFFLVMAVFRIWVFGASIEFALMPMMSPTFMIFSFHMITDPMTTPKNFGPRCLFVLAVAIIDTYLRVRFVPFGNFYALFVMSFVYAIYWNFIKSENTFRMTTRVMVLLILFAVPVTLHFNDIDAATLLNRRGAAAIEPKSSRTKELFVQAQEEMGIHHTIVDPIVDPRVQKQIRIQWIAPGVAVEDFNNDGWMDFFVINSNAGSTSHGLFINQQGRSFVNEAVKWNIAVTDPKLIPQSVTPIDYDNDGDIDLVLNGPGCGLLFRNDGQHFSDVTSVLGFNMCGNSSISLPFDFNRDGWMDLYVARFFSEDIDLRTIKDLSLFGPDRFSHSTNGGIDFVLMNDGGKAFRRDHRFDEKKPTWTWDVGIADLTGKNNFYLSQANDFGPDRYYEMTTKGFKDVSDTIRPDPATTNMNVSFGYWDNEIPQVMMSNSFKRGFVVRGNTFLQLSESDNRLIDHQLDRGAMNCEWSWGALFGDFNLDGQDDLYVASGMYSPSNSGGNDLDTNFFKMMTTKQASLDLVNRETQTVFSFINLKEPFGGFQRDCLFMRDGDGYTNKSEHNSAIDIWDGRAVAAIDYDNNGALDLIVTTQGSPIRFLKSTITEPKNWIGLALRGPASLTMGAVVKMRQGRRHKYHWFQNGKSGLFSYSDPRIHFGLSNSVEMVDIEIKLTNGKVKVWRSLPPGHYYIMNVIDGEVAPQ